jgi:hypothetical protein
MVEETTVTTKVGKRTPWTSTSWRIRHNITTTTSMPRALSPPLAMASPSTELAHSTALLSTELGHSMALLSMVAAHLGGDPVMVHNK